MFRYKRIIIQYLHLALILSIPTLSCGFKGFETSEVTLSFPGLPSKNLLFYRALQTGVNTGPATLSAFNCLMVNVMGQGIEDWNSNASTVKETAGCGYLGVYSRVFSIDTRATVSLEVLNGTGRIVQVLGIKKTSGCDEKTPTKSEFDNLSEFTGVFEIGRAVVDVSGQTNVTINNAYEPVGATDMRCYLGTSIQNQDVAEPTIPSGTITASSIAETSVNLSWTAAQDNKSSQANLKYKVVRSSATTEIDTVAKADSATTVIDWTANLTSTSVSSLSSATAYAFTVLVKDESENKSLYTPLSVTTASGGGGGGGGGTHTVTLLKDQANSSCSGGGVQWSITPYGNQTIGDGQTASYTVVRCNGGSSPTLGATNTCGGSFTSLGNDTYTYTSDPITQDCDFDFN